MSLNDNLVAGQRAIAMALECTPQGSSNKGNPAVPVGEMRAYAAEVMQELDGKFERGSVERLNNVLNWGKAARTKGMGNCMELAALAFTHLYQEGVRPLDYLYFGVKGYDHAWIVIGRDENATADLSTWGAEAVWCDPWAAPGGLNFSVAGLVAGTTHIVDHHFDRAIDPAKLKGDLKDVLVAGDARLYYRASG